MIVFQFPFQFDGGVFYASCHLVPPPGKQYHLLILDPALANIYGENHIIIIKGEELNWGIPAVVRGSEFIRAVVTGMKAHPHYL